MTSKKATTFMAVPDMLFLNRLVQTRKKNVYIVGSLYSCLPICLLMVCRKNKIKGKIFTLFEWNFFTMKNGEMQCCTKNKALESLVKPGRVTISGLSQSFLLVKRQQQKGDWTVYGPV